MLSHLVLSLYKVAPESKINIAKSDVGLHEDDKDQFNVDILLLTGDLVHEEVDRLCCLSD